MRARRSKNENFQWRFVILKIFFLCVGAAIIGRLFSLQILDHQKYAAAADRQQGVSLTLTAKRGMMYFQDKDGNRKIAALNKEWPAVAVIPKSVKEPETVSLELSSALNISKESIDALLAKTTDPFEIVARKIDPQKAEAIDSKKLSGVQVFSEFRRFYPGGSLASQALGFINFEKDIETGQYGLERFYNAELSGEAGILSSTKDAKGTLLYLGRKILKPQENGAGVILTIDPNIQKKSEEEIKKLVKKWDAESASFLVMDPLTGKILALGGYPDFDPNYYSKERDISVFNNPIISSQYELGSIMKPVTMAAGINEGLVNPDTTYTDTGEAIIGAFHIKNYDLQAHGVQTMTQVLEKSLNTGAMYVETLLGKETFLSYMESFGFGEKTGIQFPNDAKGNISNLSYNRDSDYATASFGQGISITPLQIAVAISAIANGGTLVQPYLVDSIEDDSGNRTIIEHPSKGQVISKETSETVTKMLVSVVENGFDNHAGIQGYFVAGKTGTAQVPYKDKRGYDPNRAIHSFVGYAPAFHPKFLMFIQLNEPRGVKFASSSITPTFHEIAKYMLSYLQIPQDIQAAPKKSTLR
ncbi:MAG: penicillin-binding protein 2 [Patescibacteria group bacterium]